MTPITPRSGWAFDGVDGRADLGFDLAEINNPTWMKRLRSNDQMARNNRFSADEEGRSDFRELLKDVSDEVLGQMYDEICRDRRRRGMDTEENDNDWSRDYRKARDTETNPNVGENEEFPDDDEGEDAGRPMRRVKSDRQITGDLRAYDGRYSSDPRVNANAYRELEAVKADVAIRARAPGIATDAAGAAFVKRFPNSARLNPHRRLRDLWEIKGPDNAA